MGIVDEIRKKTDIGAENGIGAVSTNTPFQSVIDEAEALEKEGLIEIVLKAPDRVRFKRLK